MPVTLIVEPSPGGHRFQTVAMVAGLAGTTDEVVLLTSAGATETEQFRSFLGRSELKVEECFDSDVPATDEIARVVAQRCRETEAHRVVVLEADLIVKRWWLVARRAFRDLPTKPRVLFMLTRYPSRARVTDLTGQKLRIGKGSLALLAMATGTLHRISAFAGRDETRAGWLVRRAVDSAVCSAHSRDRAAIRAELGLPADRRLVGIYGTIYARKNVPLVFEALLTSGVADADLMLAGPVQDDVHGWLDALPPEQRARILVRDGFPSNSTLDKLVAAADVVPIVLTNNGPSGFMGKALAAGVPVVTAGSRVRERELRAYGGGEIAEEFTAASIGAALARALRGGAGSASPARRRLPTGADYASVILGVPAGGYVYVEQE